MTEASGTGKDAAVPSEKLRPTVCWVAASSAVGAGAVCRYTASATAEISSVAGVVAENAPLQTVTVDRDGGCPLGQMRSMLPGGPGGRADCAGLCVGVGVRLGAGVGVTGAGVGDGVTLGAGVGAIGAGVGVGDSLGAGVGVIGAGVGVGVTLGAGV